MDQVEQGDQVEQPDQVQVDLVRALESIDTNNNNNHHNELPIPIEIVDQSINNALPLPQHPQQQQQSIDGSQIEEEDHQELHEWTREQLHAEIVKLRRMAKSNSNNTTPISTPTPIDASKQQDEVEKALEAVQHIREHSSVLPSDIDPNLHQNQDAFTPIAIPSTSVSIGLVSGQEEGGSSTTKRRVKRKRNNNETDTKEEKIVKRDEGTGKRLEKDRKTELSKCVRTKIRSWLGVGMDDPLPHPQSNPTSAPQNGVGLSTNAGGMFIPDWSQQLNDDVNVDWVNKISEEIYKECLNGLYPKIPQSDITPEVIDRTTKTAFVNMCKRYAQENDPKGEERRGKYTKKRRRWARKDLKQKRRTRTASDPSFQNLNLPLSALHIDYMSSEYSSSGEDTEGELENILNKRKGLWDDMRRKQVDDDQPTTNGNGSGKNGWVVGLSEKVLEVRTPRWRSESLNEIYNKLDAHAAQISDTRSTSKSTSTPRTQTPLDSSTSSPSPITIRAGHVAPSHRRFTMSPGIMRKGNIPRDLGEGWMWASGMGGVWPEEAARWIGGAEFAHSDMTTDVVGNGEQENTVDMGVGTNGQTNDTGVNTNHEHEQEQARLGLVNALEGL
ncbi:hypothetical protein I302_107202 [Kwoniella bestiolae CBS 10118]|uniref:Uncharacterized protein n=1 Tax=Kwoniella bestiolae CBS 10118 TaxID=1296100 RepID=A0A1B9FZ89_9TREE|nr:hypothetical protein I302_05532 [Kwoniella bestiolae CBS 10118]OCF24075.1 hypothetical protein I302_05532 [Kwoniella bestiolae CBS 10118]